MKHTLSTAFLLLSLMLTPVTQAAVGSSRTQDKLTPQVAQPGAAQDDSVRVMGDYEDCVVTYDARKGESRDSGTNTISFRSSSGTWTVSYSFGSGNYLMSGGGNLEGKSINVRFDGGRPASLKSSYGSGYCRVTSASRN